MSRYAFAVLLLMMAAASPRAGFAMRYVRYAPDVSPGTIVIDASRRTLFLVVREGEAIAYPVGVPKPGWEWSGSARVNGKYVRPDWIPPDSVLEEEPNLPRHVRGGAPNNPMGARAITLDRSEIAIHGSTQRMRASIGGAHSHGCIRMRNEDVIDLYNRVDIGTPVIMAP